MRTQYARVGKAHVAYRVFGDGPVDLLLLLGEYLPVDAIDEEPRYSKSLRRLTSLGRVITFNRRGVGLSDAPDGPLTLEQQVEDAVCVLDAAGSERAVVIGSNVSGPAAIRIAADHPGRTSALVLMNTWARLVADDDYPAGFPYAVVATTADRTTATEQTDFDFLTTFAPSVAQDERFRAWWEQAGNRAAGPARARELWQLIIDSDVRDVLGAIAAPTLIVQRAHIRIGHYPELGRYLRDHIPGAHYVELEGEDLHWWIGDTDPILDEIETFVTGTGVALRAQRRLATVLFLDVVGSTERAVAIGDSRWRDVLATYHDVAHRSLSRWGGSQVGTAGDGVVATFDMPADAIRCGRDIAAGVRALDIDIRAGVHTGEIEIVGDDVAGIGVHIAARVMSAAAPGEVLVSRTVSDLVTGSGLTFEDRGEHELKGVPGRWGLFAVKDR